MGSSPGPAAVLLSHVPVEIPFFYHPPPALGSLEPLSCISWVPPLQPQQPSLTIPSGFCLPQAPPPPFLCPLRFAWQFLSSCLTKFLFPWASLPSHRLFFLAGKFAARLGLSDTQLTVQVPSRLPDYSRALSPIPTLALCTRTRPPPTARPWSSTASIPVLLSLRTGAKLQHLVPLPATGSMGLSHLLLFHLVHPLVE